MNTTLINIIKDYIMMHMHKEEWPTIVHTILPTAVLNSLVLDKHNILNNTILIQYTQKTTYTLRILHPQRGKVGRRPTANEALNVSVATAQVPQLRPFLQPL